MACVPHATSEPDIRILHGLPERVGRPQVWPGWYVMRSSPLGWSYCVASQVSQRLTAARLVLPCVAQSGWEGERRRHAPGEGVSTQP